MKTRSPGGLSLHRGSAEAVLCAEAECEWNNNKQVVVFSQTFVKIRLKGLASLSDTASVFAI